MPVGMATAAMLAMTDARLPLSGEPVWRPPAHRLRCRRTRSRDCS